MKIYKLEFVPSAFKEWNKLGINIKEQFKKKLSECIQNPHIPKNRINGGKNLYKIKLKSCGYRLVYQVNNEVVTILVLSVGKRERNEVYKEALARLLV